LPTNRASTSNGGRASPLHAHNCAPFKPRGAAYTPCSSAQPAVATQPPAHPPAACRRSASCPHPPPPPPLPPPPRPPLRLRPGRQLRAPPWQLHAPPVAAPAHEWQLACREQQFRGWCIGCRQAVVEGALAERCMHLPSPQPPSHLPSCPPELQLPALALPSSHLLFPPQPFPPRLFPLSLT